MMSRPNRTWPHRSLSASLVVKKYTALLPSNNVQARAATAGIVGERGRVSLLEARTPEVHELRRGVRSHAEVEIDEVDLRRRGGERRVDVFREFLRPAVHDHPAAGRAEALADGL